ncbi:MAG TPA: DUF5947 family protein [Polyangiaceae bacterium]|nr:DUF5947 family protein [Polyangiaceae bacterium]
MSARGLEALRRFAGGVEPAAERCALCGVALGAEHPHLVEPAARRLLCACAACAAPAAIGPGGRYRRVPGRVRKLAGLRLDDGRFRELGVPVGLAFLFRNSVSGRAVAIYPGPAGPTEADVKAEAWAELIRDNPELGALEDDVEALLVYRLGRARAHFVVPVDECYRLVGLVRTLRSSLFGAPAPAEVEAFLARLERLAGGSPGRPGA